MRRKRETRSLEIHGTTATLPAGTGGPTTRTTTYAADRSRTSRGRTGATSNTAGAWVTGFPTGLSTFSLPLGPYPWVDHTASGWVDTAGEFVTVTGARTLAYMDAGRWRYVPGDGDPNRILRLGAG